MNNNENNKEVVHGIFSLSILGAYIKELNTPKDKMSTEKIKAEYDKLNEIFSDDEVKNKFINFVEVFNNKLKEKHGKRNLLVFVPGINLVNKEQSDFINEFVKEMFNKLEEE